MRRPDAEREEGGPGRVALAAVGPELVPGVELEEILLDRELHEQVL